MAGNKNAWRDIFTVAEWMTIKAQASAAAAKLMAGHRAAPAPTGWTVGTTAGTVTSPATALAQIDSQIAIYHAIAKDDSTNFAARVAKLRYINTLCTKYLQLLNATHRLGVKSGGGKQLTDQLDVWVRSLGNRALKKAGYLEEMLRWHQTAKAKYQDKASLSMFLRQLDADNTRAGGTMLHATPYATIEKIDPYHRQTFVFVDPNDATGAGDVSQNEMGSAFVAYLTDQPAAVPDPATNANATFYEWLEYHPFCVGTPGVSGDARYKSPNTISYDNLDLAHVFMPDGGMEYERIVSNPGNRLPLNTGTFRASGKGPPGAAAFVWAADSHLWAHEHGWDGFIHASAQKGKKIRCSGMLVAVNGKATWITNQSGHYAPNAQSIYLFTAWLLGRHCLHATCKVKMDHDPQAAGEHKVVDFLRWGRGQFGAAAAQPYHI